MSRPTRLAAATCLTLLASTLIAPVVLAPAARADVGDVTPFSLPAGSGSASAIGATTAGDLWVGFTDAPALARVTTEGVASLVPIAGLPAKSSVGGIAQDAAGRIWFTSSLGNALWSVNGSGGDPRRIDLPNAGSYPIGITLGPDGNLWFAEFSGGRVGRITPAGALSEFTTFSAPLGIRPSGIAAGTGNWLALFGSGNGVTQAQVGTITTAGASKTIPNVVTAYPSDGPAVTPDGSIWVTLGKSKALIRIAPDGTGSSVGVDGFPGGLATAADGSLWFSFVGDKKGVGRLEPGGALKLFPTSASPQTLVAGPDGNMWATTDGKQVLRVLTGIKPENTSPPAVSSPAGSTNATGTVLTASNGDWKFQPSKFAQQWQRCTTNDPGSCADIPGATESKYTVADADLGGFVRANITATNLNGAGKPSSSPLLQLAAKPVAPTQPTTPPPVAGAGSVQVAKGVTARLSSPSNVKRKVKRTYKFTFTAPLPRGSVRISLMDGAGTEVYVLGDAVRVRGAKKIAYAVRSARIPRSVAKGAYTLRAVYTPTTAQAATYPIATVTRPLRLR